ncbi:MAG TPA: nitrophenyl compound nitroreductase subunit ArsF family protein, partial [Thermoguttaceae bacterium]|nr:nitrophenyl compound nitroreductase subunit ArsF family protein [Thermoguttaceae bacterium]
MELKNAVAICLIAMFSATLVVLIARSLDSQAAARLEPQLAKIAEELETIRKQGGMATASNQEVAAEPTDDALMVYYFHGVRCANCLAAEANAHAAIQSRYASQLSSGEVVWKVLDYMTDPVAKKMAIDFDVITATLVLVKMKDGQIDVWNRLDQTLSLAEDAPALSAYLQGEMDEMLKAPEAEPEAVSQTGPSVAIPEIPVPEGETADLPLPTGPAEIP